MTKHTFISIVKHYISLVKKDGIPVEKVIVFGSQVKGTAHKWSDIDVCVVSRLFGHDRLDERVRLMNLTNIETENIEPHPFHPDDLENKWDPLASEIRKYGIVVN